MPQIQNSFQWSSWYSQSNFFLCHDSVTLILSSWKCFWVHGLLLGGRKKNIWSKQKYIYPTCLRHLQYLIFYFHWKKANMWAICDIYVWNIRRRSPIFVYLLLDDLQTLQLVSRSSRPEAEEETLDLLLRILGRLHRILSSLLYGPSSSCI